MRIFAALAAVAVTIGIAGCAAAPRETLLAGETMGSAWTAKVVGPLPIPEAELLHGMQARFEAVNRALSTYRPDSALSRFNDDATGHWLEIEPELAAVMGYALDLAARSDGAYDVTVGPLVNLWGFGPDLATRKVPDPAAIAAARERVGWRKVEVDIAAARARKPPGVRVDLSSLGKGRGVDRVAEYLDSVGVSNYLVDLSGKLRGRGRNARGEFWRVAVETPGADDPSGPSIAPPAIVELRDESVATAGDYRRFFEVDGKHYSHIIDPRTGFPVAHATVSATALAADCMAADAWATVFMAMAPADALRLAETASIPALLIRREGGGYAPTSSARWPR
jgi:thiamine biosynthesis lipoprotein